MPVGLVVELEKTLGVGRVAPPWPMLLEIKSPGTKLLFTAPSKSPRVCAKVR